MLIDEDAERVPRQRVPALRIVGLQIFREGVYACEYGVNAAVCVASSRVGLCPEHVLHGRL